VSPQLPIATIITENLYVEREATTNESWQSCKAVAQESPEEVKKAYYYQYADYKNYPKNIDKYSVGFYDLPNEFRSVFPVYPME
jgi:hypothetical protein